MHKNIFRRALGYGLGLSLVLGVFSCSQRTDDIFPDTPGARVDSAVSELQKQLVSSPHGWLIEYLPGANAERGGYNVGVRFSDKGEVLVRSEVLGNGSWAKSEYVISKDHSISINFDTFNRNLHVFASPDTGSDNWEGDYEFIVMEQGTSPDTILVKGKRNRNEMRFIRATQPIDEYFDSIEALKQKATSFAKMDANAQDALLTTIDGKQRTLTFLNALQSAFVVQTEGQGGQEIVSFIYTPTGIRLYKPIGGVSEFNWDDAKGRYVAPSGEELTPRRDPLYDKYQRFEGNYVFSFASEGRRARQFNVSLKLKGTRVFTLSAMQGASPALPFDLKVGYNVENDTFEILTQEFTHNSKPIGVIPILTTEYLSFRSDAGLIASLVPNSSPETYNLVNNGVVSGAPVQGFVLWDLSGSGEQYFDLGFSVIFGGPRLQRIP